jgi:adhesin transport system outer membrane protein
MISRRNIFFLTMLFNLMPVNCQELYDLNKCITTGLERNFSILIARNNEEISNNNHSLGNAGYLPSVGAGSYYGGSLNDYKQNLITGEENIIKGVHNTSANAEVNLSWTIFKGFSAHTNYKKLNELKLIGELNTQMAVEDLIADIVSEYYYYIQQIRLYHNLAYAVSLSRERVRIDQERYLLGASSKLQLLQSLVYLNSDSSRHARQNEVLRASQVRLNKLMASDNLGENIILRDTSIQINSGLVYDSLYAATLRSNTSLLIARRNQTVSEYDYKLITARSYPYLDFSSGYDHSWYTYETGNYNDQKINSASIGFTLGVDIFDGLNKKRERANARLEINNKQHQYQQVDQQVKADLITFYFAYQNNLLLLELEKQNLLTAQENLEIALERYKLGNLSGLELREVQQSLLEAEERLLSAQYQTKLAEISLLQISGRITDYLDS